LIEAHALLDRHVTRVLLVRTIFPISDMADVKQLIARIHALAVAISPVLGRIEV
jgi:hypothetical protein